MIFKECSKLSLILAVALTLVLAGCGGKKSDVATSARAAEEVQAPVVNELDTTIEAKDVIEKPSVNAVYFAFDSAEVDNAGMLVLESYAEWLNANENVNITIEGNCDERGSREYNLALGEERAKAIKAELVADGVNASRIDTVSYGEERPVCTRSGEACWAQNRRGDIVSR